MALRTLMTDPKPSAVERIVRFMRPGTPSLLTPRNGELHTANGPMDLDGQTFSNQLVPCPKSGALDFPRVTPAASAALVSKTHQALLLPKQTDSVEDMCTAMHGFVHAIAFFGFMWNDQVPTFIKAIGSMTATMRMSLITSVCTWTRKYPDETPAIAVSTVCSSGAFATNFNKDGLDEFQEFMTEMEPDTAKIKRIVMPLRLYNIIGFLMLMFCNADLVTVGIEVKGVRRPSEKDVADAFAHIMFAYCTTIYNANMQIPSMLTPQAVAAEMVGNIVKKLAGNERYLMTPTNAPADRLSAFTLLVCGALNLDMTLAMDDSDDMKALEMHSLKETIKELESDKEMLKRRLQAAKGSNP